jgi:hypothetical protein
MAAAEERQHVVLAQAVHLDVLHDHHAAGVLREERVVDHLLHVGAVPLGEEGERLRHSQRRLLQALARRVFAELDEQLPHQRFDLLDVRFHGQPPP